MNKKLVIERVKREIIENKLLTVLNNEEKVAIAVDKHELEDLIVALNNSFINDVDMSNRIKYFVEGLEKLYKAAFK